ncbi:MAG: RnfH family protein [Gammaproteobacteria bacterium]|nr:RnfH family protein [Gammaproteobacteria bacterium]NND53531.1 RnfH family protein [Gammaproteobacteria bacterium]
MPENLINVEVVYATPKQQTLLALQLPADSTAREAVCQSGLQSRYPEIDINHCPVGIFGAVVKDTQVLQDGDRVEIYRSLINEPREARRKVAARGGTMGSR